MSNENEDNNSDEEAENKTVQEPIKKTKPSFSKVEELSPASVGFNLIVKLAGTPMKEIIKDRVNLDRTILNIREQLIGDSTACILLSLRNGIVVYNNMFFF